MKEYKIRVNNETESREAQELFFELGYKWGAVGSQISYLDMEYLFADKLGDLTYSSATGTFNDSDYYEITLPQLRELAKPQSELISGAEAKLAWAKGEDVQILCAFGEFCTITTNLSLSIFDDPKVKFRLKPRTVKLEIEVTAPFEPKRGDIYWHIATHTSKGYSSAEFKDYPSDKFSIMYGAWRTETEIKIVVEQLRKLKELGK